jgi:hypothetical protein
LTAKDFISNGLFSTKEQFRIIWDNLSFSPFTILKNADEKKVEPQDKSQNIYVNRNFLFQNLSNIP